MHLHLCACWRSCSPCQSSMDYGNTKTPSMHPRLGSATLLQLAFLGEGNPNFPWEKSHWDSTVVKSKVLKTWLMDREKDQLCAWSSLTLCCSEGSKKTLEETKRALREKEAELIKLKADLEMSKLVAEERKKVQFVPFGDSGFVSLCCLGITVYVFWLFAFSLALLHKLTFVFLLFISLV